jgi:hypothetical protein
MNDEPTRRPWPTWSWYLIACAILGLLLISDAAGWLASFDPVRSP